MRFGRTGLWIFAVWMTGLFAQSVDTPAPLFSGTGMDGKTIQLSDYKGKVVLLDIWASWCGPCKQEIPFLIETDRQYRDQGLAILTINIDKDVKNVQKFISFLETPPAFPVIQDSDAKIPPLYKVEGMPTTVLIDRNGIIRYRHVGFKSEKKNMYLEEINALLKEKKEL